MIFSEIYGDYFNAIAAVLTRAAEGGLTGKELTAIVRETAFGETSLFLGMISAFLGYVFSGFSGVFRGETAGLVPPLVMLASGVMMGLCGAALKKLGWRWMNDYALPISLIAGMAAAIPITAWLG